MNGRQRILKVLGGGAPDRPARGEIWPLPAGGTAAEILTAAQNIGADFCFFDQLPGAVSTAQAEGLVAGAIVNGPWQRWLSRVGWETAMAGMARGNDAMREGLREECTAAGRELLAWVASGADMILLADDIAYAGGPLMAPARIEAELLPLYAELVKSAAGTGAAVGFHTDGRADLFLPLLHTAGFRFYSLEPEGTDPQRAWSLLGSQLPIFSGLPAAWLLPGGFTAGAEGDTLRGWLGEGPLILASACGLYHEAAQESLAKIYSWVDSIAKIEP